VGPMCPATFAAVPQNTHCGNYGLVCDYTQGRCACTTFAGPVAIDASAAARWICQNPSDATCPKPRAPLGSACSQQGLTCDYGSCSVPGGSAEQCDAGIWQQAFTPCPLASGG
jgi:hypothetical protein